MELMERIRNMIVLKIARHPDPYLVLFDYSRAELERYAIHATLSELQQWYRLISEAEQKIKVSPQPRFLLEMALADMAHVQALEPLEDLNAELDSLQTLISNAEPETRSLTPQSAAESSASFLEPPSAVAQQSYVSQLPRAMRISAPHRSYDPPSQELLQTWNAILDIVRQKSPGLKATLRHAEPLELTPKVLILGFHPDNEFAQSRLQDQKNVAIVQEAVKEHLGYAVQVQTTVYDGAMSTETMQEKLSQQPASQAMPEIPTQPYTPPGSSRTQTSSERNHAGWKSNGKSEWKGERNGGNKSDRKGRGKQSSQYKPPVQVSVDDVVRLFDGEVEE